MSAATQTRTLTETRPHLEGLPRGHTGTCITHTLLSQYTVTITREINTTVKSTQMETAKGGKVLLSPWMR